MIKRLSHPVHAAQGIDTQGSPPTPAGGLPPAVVAALDAQALQRLINLDPDGNSGLLLRVLHTFDASLARLTGQAKDAWEAVDYTALRHVSHTLKSSSASVGALELSALCAEVERQAREQSNEGLDGLMAGLVAESGRILAALRTLGGA